MRVRNYRVCGICMTLTVLINAGPWLPVPPPDYGGIENVLATLIPELRARGVEVVLCTVEESTVEVDDRRCAFPDGQSCLNLAAARLRYIAGTAWSAKCYMNMRPLYQPQVMQTEAVA